MGFQRKFQAICATIKDSGDEICPLSHPKNIKCHIDHEYFEVEYNISTMSIKRRGSVLRRGDTWPRK